jgi:hypothetical protein
MNEASFTLGRFTKFLEDGTMPTDTSPYLRWKAAQSTTGILASADSINEENRRAALKAQINDLDEKLKPVYGLDEETKRQVRLRRFDKQIGLDQSNNQASMPPMFSQEEIERWQEIDRERARGEAYSRLGGGGARSSIPLPRPRPAEADADRMPPVQPLDNAPQRVDVQGTVNGEVHQVIEIKASSYFEAAMQRLENAIKLVGSLNANGPGSAGKSSPDAGAPAVGFNGVP